MTDAFDAIVIGAGHNGLVTAAYLAKAGLRVLIVERRDLVGGAAVTEEVFPGFHFDTGAHRVNRLHPSVVLDLGLAAHGLELAPCDPSVFAPALDSPHLLLWRKPQQAKESIARLSQTDADRWANFAELISKACGFLEHAYDHEAPDLFSRGLGERYGILRLIRRVRRLGRPDMTEVLRILPMSIRELLDEWFESELLKGTLGSLGIMGMFQGPMAAGTAYIFLHHHVGRHGGALRSTTRVRGGLGNLARALAGAARQAGVEIRTGAEVEHITIADGRATGVVLSDGQQIAASRIISNADPRRTLLELVDPLELDTTFLRAVRNIRYKGACARVNLALSELPQFSDGPADGSHLRGAIAIAPSIEYLERAYDDAKYGRLSREPYLEAIIPSVTEPELAPHGRHTMSIFVQYAPYHLEEGFWDSSRREALGDLVVRTLTRYAPNLESAIVHRQVLTPLDLEQTFGLSEGNIYHGEMTLDQLFIARPVPGWARYRTPIKNLYLCGAGTHPGGGVTGAPGYHAARQILKRSTL
ncbi:MAG: NAD(P)/FAD-dependent oxidoreductase [Gemmatimonadota bacterium]|nr:MAG: NAD(P)/FAD-dependent oxidoreductase [Gemmatimonadota bacterium]